MTKRNYMVLTSMSQQTAIAGKQLLQNLTVIDSQAKPLWFDSAHVGIVLSTDLTAIEIWANAINDIKNVNELFRDILIVEIGKDWAARNESKYAHWLKTHVGSPLSPSRR